MERINAEELLDALIAHYNESIFITDKDGMVVFANEVSVRNLGTTLEKVLYRNVRDIISDGIYTHSTAMEAARTKKPVIAAINPERPDSSISHSVPVLDENGEVRMVVTDNIGDNKFREWEKVLAREREKFQRVQTELNYLRHEKLTHVIAVSWEMKQVLAKAKVVAPTDTTVVIYGESGTGKDVIAHFIHNESDRAGEPFIRINCAAIPESLMESELFGYEKGSFTGAGAKGKIGLFEAANHGTVFLDEVSDMPLQIQAKLLRVLENRELRRIGGIEDIPVDIRIICASNRNLKVQAEKKEFREDLYYRLNVFPISIPPLRQRKEDIFALAELFLDQLNDKYSTTKTFSPESERGANEYPWPGNVRELRNVVERAYIIAASDIVDIAAETRTFAPQACQERENTGMARPKYDSLKKFMIAAEDQYISEILRECGENVAQAARRLGIHRSALYRKLNKESINK